MLPMPTVYPQFFETSGAPLDSGYIYIGEVNENPETHPITVYWDAEGTQPVAQPLRTSGGYIVRNGAPAMVFIDSDCSITVKNKKQALVYYAASTIAYNATFSQAFTYPTGTLGAHANTYITVQDAPFYAKADGDGTGGGTDASAAIQAAHDAIKAKGKAGVLHIPSGIYRCDSGLIIDASVVRIDADGALLDFTNLASDGVAMTVSGGTLSYVGNPFFNSYNAINGLKMYGGTWGGSGTKVGVDFNGASHTASGAHSGMRDCVLYGFQIGLQISQNSYILAFDHIEVCGCGTAVYEPTATNAGERIVFNNSAFYNCNNGFALQNAIASTFLNHCTIDGMSQIYFYITAGHLCVTDCHIEGTYSGTNPGARMFWNDSVAYPSYSYVNWVGNHVLVKKGVGTVRLNPVFDFNGAIIFNAFGGYVYANDYPDTAAPVFSGSGSGMITVIGTEVDNGLNTLNNITGPKYHFDLGNNLDSNRNYGSVQAPEIRGTTVVSSDSGLFFNRTKTVTLVSLSTLYSLGIGTSSGLLVCRDGTSGGTAVFACDPSSGVVSIQNSITGLAASYSGSQLSLQVTSGAANRQIRWIMLKTQD
jgi:hypothetical protein